MFKIQKRALRIMTNKSKRESCRPLYNQLQILTLPSQYIFSLLIFVVKNKDLFLLNSDIHTINTHNNSYNTQMYSAAYRLSLTSQQFYAHIPLKSSLQRKQVQHCGSALIHFKVVCDKFKCTDI